MSANVPTRRGRRRWTATTGTAVLVLLLAGCGGSAEGVQPGDTIAGTDLAARVRSAMSDAGSVRVTFDGAGFSASGLMTTTPADPRQDLIAKVGSQTVALVRVGPSSWADGLAPATAAEAQALATRPWRLLTTARVDALDEGERGLVTCLEVTDPTTLVDALASTTATVALADADSQTVLATIAPDLLLGDQAAAAGVTEPIDLTVVLDARARPVGVTADLQGQTLRLSYADWGTPTSIAPPAAAQVLPG